MICTCFNIQMIFFSTMAISLFSMSFLQRHGRSLLSVWTSFLFLGETAISISYLTSFSLASICVDSPHLFGVEVCIRLSPETVFLSQDELAKLPVAQNVAHLGGVPSLKKILIITDWMTGGASIFFPNFTQHNLSLTSEFRKALF